MSLSPRFLDDLRNRLTLSEVIGKRVKVTRAGREFKACCPFHHEKTPSFTINDDKQFYHCFGCGAHGDIIGFVMQHDNLAFMDAIELLAADAGMQVPKPSPEQAAKAAREKDLYQVMDDAAVFFEQYLYTPRNEDALGYLLDRGLTRETLQQFRVGFAPEDGQVLRKYMLSKGHDDRDMIKLGLLKPSSRGGDPYTFFRDRIMFPVIDRRGRVVAFGGRILPEHIRPPQRTDFTPPKYINSSETPLFHKGKMLYGEVNARRAAASGQRIVLVEGYMDVIACVQAGIEGALAPMGTAVTEEQIAVMWAMIPDFEKVPILCFDGDNAGRKAAARVSDLILPLLEPGRSVDFAFMPDGEDPDSLIKAHGVKGVQRVLGSAAPLFDFIWNSHVQGRDFKTPEMRAGVIKQLENIVSRVANRDVQVHYRSLLKEKVSQTFFARKKDFSSGYGYGYGSTRGRSSGNGRLVPIKPVAPKSHARLLYCKVLLAGLINHPSIFDSIEDVFMELSFGDRPLEMLRQACAVYLADEDEWREDGAKLVEYLNNSGYSQEISDICNESVYVHASFCSPRAQDDVPGKWLEYWKDGKAAGLNEEIQDRWKEAYNNSSEEDEDRLRTMLQIKSSSGDVS